MCVIMCDSGLCCRRFGGIWYPHIQGLYRVSQEECTKLRESVPYVKLYQYNPKHLYPKLNGYGDNGHRKVWVSCGSTYCNSCTTQYASLRTPLQWLNAGKLRLMQSRWRVQYSEFIVRSCKNAVCVFPHGILWHAFCVGIFRGQCTCCCWRTVKRHFIYWWGVFYPGQFK
jgi:hypothetical protein